MAEFYCLAHNLNFKLLMFLLFFTIPVMVLMFLLLVLLLGQILKLEGEISYIPVVMDINNKLGNEEGNHYLLDDIFLGMP